MTCSKDPLDAVRKKIPIEFQYLAGIFDGDGVGAVLSLFDVTILFNKTGDEYAWVEDGKIQTVRAINDPLSLFRKDPLGSVGAAMYVIHTGPDQIYLFDKSGERYTVATIETSRASGQWDNPDLLTFNTKNYASRDWGGKNECPFSTIGAIWEFQPNRYCSIYFPDYYGAYMTNGDGNLMTIYAFSKVSFSGLVESVDQYEIYACGGEGVDKFKKEINTLPIKTIDAVMTLMDGSTAIGELFFTSEGKQFGYNLFETGKFIGPYDLY